MATGKRKRDVNKELFDALLAPDYDKVQALLAEGVDPDSVGSSVRIQCAHQSALWCAVRNAVQERDGDWKEFNSAMEELLGLHKRDPEGRREMLIRIIRVLLAAGARLELHCFGGTPLRIAVSRDDKELTELLLSHGADPNAKTYSPLSKTAKVERIKGTLGYMGYLNRILHEAVEMGNSGIVQLLLNAGADRAVVDQDGKTPLQIAREKGHQKLISLLQVEPREPAKAPQMP
jgi:uncharacterized protein